MILADQFLLGILADGAELVVHVSNRALDVGHRHDGVLIQSELLVGQFPERIVRWWRGFPSAASSARLRSVMSARMATYWRGLPSVLMNGTMVVSTQ